MKPNQYAGLCRECGRVVEPKQGFSNYSRAGGGADIESALRNIKI